MFDNPLKTRDDVAGALRSDRPSSPRSDSPIRDQVSFLEDQCKALHAGYDALEERLDTILRPVPPSVATGVSAARAGGGVSDQMPPESHLIGRLRMLNDAFNALQQRFQHLHARIEL